MLSLMSVRLVVSREFKRTDRHTNRIARSSLGNMVLLFSITDKKAILEMLATSGQILTACLI